MAGAYHEIFAAVGTHSGLAHGAARDFMSAFTAMQGGASPGIGNIVPVIVFHGDRDGSVAGSNLETIVTSRLSVLAEEDPAGDPPVPVILQSDAGGRPYTRTTSTAADGATVAESWLLQGAGHAWSGGYSAGSFIDSQGPDASAEMVRFFGEHFHDSR